MNRYNFDQMIDRRNTDCVKYDGLQDVFGCADLLPMWVADMDFRVPPEVQEAARKCCEQGIFGYTFRSDDGKGGKGRMVVFQPRDCYFTGDFCPGFY